jgi:hypothetical protein
LDSRRPKPPPQRIMWIATSSGFTPRVRETSWRPGSGFWVGAHSSSLPSAQRAVQFCGSSGWWLTKG